MRNGMSPEMVARIHAYRALGYSYDEITEQLGISYNTVSKYLNNAKDEAKKSDDPLEVFSDRVENLLTVNVSVKDRER